MSNSVTPCLVAHQAPLSMGFSRQEYWSGLPFPPPGDLPKDGTHVSCLLRWQVGSLPLALPGKPGSSNNLLEKKKKKKRQKLKDSEGKRETAFERGGSSLQRPLSAHYGAPINTRWLGEIHQCTTSLITAHTLLKSLTKSQSAREPKYGGT